MAHEDEDAIWGLFTEGFMDPPPDLIVGFNQHTLAEVMAEAGLPKSSAERILMDKNLRDRLQQDLTEVCWRWLVNNAGTNYSKHLAPPPQTPAPNPKAQPRPGESQWSAA